MYRRTELWIGCLTSRSTIFQSYTSMWRHITYGEILNTLFMRFKSRDPLIYIFFTWSRDYDSNAFNRFYTKNKKNMNYSWQSGYPESVMDHELVHHVHILWYFNLCIVCILNHFTTAEWCWKRLKGVFKLKWNFFGKRWDESLLIFRLYALMLVLLDAGFVDSYWISDAFWSQTRIILHFFADFDIHNNVMNMKLRFRNLTVNGTPNFLSMKLNLDLLVLDRWGHTE